MSALASRSYEDVEAELRPLTVIQDPPIDRVDDVWKIRASVDAFVHLGHRIGPDDLDRLRQVVTGIFSRVALPPDPDAPFTLTPPPSAIIVFGYVMVWRLPYCRSRRYTIKLG